MLLGWILRHKIEKGYQGKSQIEGARPKDQGEDIGWKRLGCNWLQCNKKMQGKFSRGMKKQMSVNTRAPRDPHQALKAQKNRIILIPEEWCFLYTCQTWYLLMERIRVALSPQLFNTTCQPAEWRPAELMVYVFYTFIYIKKSILKK